MTTLTGLPNRLLLGQRLAESIASADLDASGTAVIFVDLDGFKFVNDTLGHEAGDVLLQQVAQRLSACVRRGDMLARMGGDEFMVVVNGVTEDQVAQSVADRLGAALRHPFFVAHHELVITASMGISIYPRDGTDVSALRRNADAAMYEAKQAGKDRIRFYRPALGAACQARLEMETDLRHALDRGELCLHYQPMYTAADNRQTAYEALARWPHPGLASCLRISSSHWRKRPASSSGWASGCCARRAANAAGGRTMGSLWSVSPSMFPPCSSPAPDFVDTVLGVLSETGLTGELLDLEAHRVHRDARYRQRNPKNGASCGNKASASRWTISAPVTLRWAICPSCLSTSSRSIAALSRRSARMTPRYR